MRNNIEDGGQNLQVSSQINIEFQGLFNEFLLNTCSSVSYSVNTMFIIETMNIEIFTRMSNSWTIIRHKTKLYSLIQKQF